MSQINNDSTYLDSTYSSGSVKKDKESFYRGIQTNADNDMRGVVTVLCNNNNLCTFILFTIDS